MKTLPFFFWLLLLIGCASSSSEVQAQTTVYITKTGTKYHTSSCRVLRQSKTSIDLKDAIERGYEACHICNPSTKASEEEDQGELNSSEQATTSTQQKPKMTGTKSKASTSKQCISLTKAGLRCKRTTNNANGSCYQHQ